jgi:hypothetical protein
MYKSHMRSIALMMAVALTASVSVSAAAVERSKPSELHFAQPAAITASTQTLTNAVASAPASTQSFVCEPEDGGRSTKNGFMPIGPRCPGTPPPPPPPGFKPNLV